MPFCEKCGKPMKQGTIGSLCPECQKKTQADYEEKKELEEKAKSSKLWILIPIVIAVIVVIVILI